MSAPTDRQAATAQGEVRFAVSSNYSLYSSEQRSGVEAEFKPCQATTLYYTYPLKLLLPEHASASQCKWLYAISYGGGLVGGDQVNLEVCVEEGIAVMMTTQSSTKVYHCLDGRVTRQQFKYEVQAGSLLFVLPDPIVCYKDAIYEQTQLVTMATDSNLVLLDWYTSGRMARGECWDFKKYHSTVSVHYSDQLIFRDSQCLQDTPWLTIKQGMGQYSVAGVMVICGPKLQEFNRNLLIELGKSKTYGARYDNTTVFSISPLKVARSLEAKNGPVTGCVIRFMSTTTQLCAKKLHEILLPLFPIIGGDPFENKY
ncbi:urease accessory protein D [Lingula anatina]|uniref:Urease accessory protein D n=1 Tax=Lingula anatina TaxID=7574 RepID=A0A1S3K0R6_LINAN|nr:urease accessory protein D [Lingula anatina]XP_013416228.1 urease accessory protein D [Lingula anatina]|eukprot:XP_013416227.1 urease accessory protein D [Lingula anatina]